MKQFPLNENINVFDTAVLPSNFIESIARAENIVNDARKRAADIIRQAETEKNDIIEQANKEAEKNAADLRQNLRDEFEVAKGKVIAEMYNRTEEFLTKFRAGVPVLIENILFRIIGEFKEAELTARCIAMGIEEMRDAAEMIIRINPQGAEEIKKYLDPWLRNAQTGGGYMKVQTDTFVKPREAVIITEIGTVELSVDNQLKTFTDNLKKQFGVVPEDNKDPQTGVFDE